MLAQDAYGNPQDYQISQLDALYATISGQEFGIPYAYPAASTSLRISPAGNYSLGIWIESPKLSARQLVGNYMLTIEEGSLDAVMTQASFFFSS